MGKIAFNIAAVAGTIEPSFHCFRGRHTATGNIFTRSSEWAFFFPDQVNSPVEPIVAKWHIAG